jgi:HK97 family phage major capsid protein
MEQKEFNQAIDSIKEVAVADATKAAEVKAAEKVEAAKSEIFVKMDEIDARVKSIDAHMAEQKKFAQTDNSKKSFGEIVTSSIKADDLLKVKNNKSESLNFDVKAAATITTGNYSGGTVGLTSWDPSFTRVARRNPFLRQIVTVRPVSDKYVAWAEQANRDGGAGNTAEGAAKSQADFDIVETSKLVEKITAYTKASKESLADISFLQSEINNDLLSLIELKLDTDLLMGSGVSPVMKGINEYATAFAAGGLANSMTPANEFDVLRAAIYQVENAYHQPSYILLNPIDVAKIDMLKDANNNYLTHNAGSQFMFRAFYGVPVIANNGVTAGSFFVGDFSKSNLGIREEVNIQIGYENDDFTKNLVTILAEMRAVHYIKTNHTAAIVKGTFAVGKAVLDSAVADS